MPRKHARLIAVAGLAASVAMVATQANAQDRVRWKMQSAFGSSLIHLGPSGVRFAERVKEMSGGAFDIRFQEPGALVPALEAFDSVSKGRDRIRLDHPRLPTPASWVARSPSSPPFPSARSSASS